MGRLLKNPGELYLSRDEEGHERFYAECGKAHEAHGFVVKEIGNCPALVAEHEQLKAEWALLNAAGAMFGFDGEAINGQSDNRKKMLDLLLGAAAIGLKK